MFWKLIDTRGGCNRWMLTPYSTQEPEKIDFWWHQEDCKIKNVEATCTCSTSAKWE